MLNIAIFISGRGSNFSAILDAVLIGNLKACILCVHSNKPGAAGLELARRNNIPIIDICSANFESVMDYERALCKHLALFPIDLIVLAGYMRVLRGPILDLYAGRIVNIHPSLLPAFKGLNAQRQALEAGVSESGCTVHFVDKTLDGGQIIKQAKVPVYDTDTEATLSARILEAEHELYPRVLNNLSRVLPER